MMPAGQPGRHLDIFAISARPYFLPAILSSGFPVDLGKNFYVVNHCASMSPNCPLITSPPFLTQSMKLPE